MLKHGMNTDQYYTLQDRPPKILAIPVKMGERKVDACYLQIFRFKALIELSEMRHKEGNGFFKVGGLGEPGDDINIIYDKDYTIVLGISNSE